MNLLLAVSLALSATASAASERGLAKGFAKAAARAGVQRTAVMPFQPMDGSDVKDGRVLSERFIGRLAARGRGAVVERGQLDAVMSEHSLGKSGALSGRGLARLGELLQAQALVLGTFVSVGGRIEAQLRLVSVETGEVLAAGEVSVKRDWSEGLFEAGAAISAAEAGAEVLAFRRGEGVPASEDQPPARPFDLRDSPSDTEDCRDYVRRADALQAGILDLKARYWTGKDSLPALTLKDPQLRLRFLQLLSGYARRPGPPLTPFEVRRFVAADGEAFKLLAACAPARRGGGAR